VIESFRAGDRKRDHDDRKRDHDDRKRDHLLSQARLRLRCAADPDG
jgi:hypothetical protein